MNSPLLAPQLTIRPPRKATPVAVAVLQQAGVMSAANAEAATADWEESQNPLWVMAIALGVFCAVAALVMVLG